MNENFNKALQEIKEYVMLAAKKAITMDEAAMLTGLSRSYLYKLTSNHAIPYYKPNGKLLYFDKQELEAWMLKNRVNTIAEAEAEAEAVMQNANINVLNR